jgi:hypothetical protein
MQQPDMTRQRHAIPVLKIIGTMLLILILICGGLVTFVAYNFPRWVSNFARGPLVAAIDQTRLPDDQKMLIKQNIARVADAYRDHRISYTQFQAILARLNNGPFFNLVGVEGMRLQYGNAHPADDEQRHETMLLFDRFARGIAEDRIPAARIQHVMSFVHDPDTKHPDPQRPGLSEAELEPFISAMRREVEAAGVPPGPFTPDFAGQIDRAVTAVLGPSASVLATRPAATTPAGPEAEAGSSASRPEPAN